MIHDKVQNNSDDHQDTENIQSDQEELQSDQEELVSLDASSDEVSTIDSKDEKILKLEMELLHLKECERDNFLRARAEIENVRRRSEQDVERAHKFALEHFFIELLPVIDNLERALNMLDRSNDLFIGTIEGIELTLKMLLDTVNKFGLQVVNEVNIPFNPSLHQAMSILESTEHKSNFIIEIMQKGYLLNNRLIRPAMVTVAK